MQTRLQQELDADYGKVKALPKAEQEAAAAKLFAAFRERGGGSPRRWRSSR